MPAASLTPLPTSHCLALQFSVMWLYNASEYHEGLVTLSSSLYENPNKNSLKKKGGD